MTWASALLSVMNQLIKVTIVNSMRGQCHLVMAVSQLSIIIKYGLSVPWETIDFWSNNCFYFWSDTKIEIIRNKVMSYEYSTMCMSIESFTRHF